MRFLFITGGSPATVFALAPLASAARLAGHDVLVAAPEDMTPYASGVGLPTVPVTDGKMLEFMFTDRTGQRLGLPTDPGERLLFNGRGFGRLAAASLPALADVAAAWRPDLVVGGSLCYAAPLLASQLGVPWVRHTWDLGEPPRLDLGAADELAKELADRGLDGWPVPDRWVDICPPSLRGALTAGPRQSMRFVPYNQQRPLRPWMYRAGTRPRVCLTLGSRVAREADVAQLRDLVAVLGRLDVEVAVAVPETIAEQLRAVAPQVRAGWLPLDALLPTCAALVHHGGGQSTLNALHAGVPQLLLPDIPKMFEPCRRVADHGAAIMLVGAEQSSERVVAAVAELLDVATYRDRARAVRAEIADQPLPADVVGVLERLVA